MGNLPGKPGCHWDVTHWPGIFPWKQDCSDVTQGQGWHGATDALEGKHGGSPLCKVAMPETFPTSLPLCFAGRCLGSALGRDCRVRLHWRLKGSQVQDFPGCSSSSLWCHPLCPSLPQALHHKLTTSPVASSSFNSGGVTSLSSLSSTEKKGKGLR